LSESKQARHQGVSNNNKDIFSFKASNMQFFRADGMKEATGYGEPKDWYFVAIKELLDNNIDWLRDNYRGSEHARVDGSFTISKDYSQLTCRLRNSNPENKPVKAFTLLPNILNYNMTFGSKQNEYRATRGQLGDGLKRLIGLPFILQNLGDDQSAFFKKQWDTPMYFRANGIERQVTVKVNLGASQAFNQIVESSQRLNHTDTEVEISFPIIEEVRSYVSALAIERHVRLNTIATTDISFNIKVIDEYAQAQGYKGLAVIDQEAKHPIPKNLHNSTSILIYHPVEFVNRIESVFDRENTSVYEVIRKFEEGAQMPKSEFDKLLKVGDTNKLSIAEFMKRPDYQDKMLELYNLLLNTSNRNPDKISLPFPLKDRHKHLAERIYAMYPPKYLEQNPDNIYYTIQYGTTTQIPIFNFAFEMLAIPLNIDSIREDPSNKQSEFHGLVNSSHAALGTRFDGRYFWTKKNGYAHQEEDIVGCLSQFGFVFSAYYRNSKMKIPCVFLGNLISQRVDYTEKSKAKMDASPFLPTILKAVRKLAS